MACFSGLRSKNQGNGHCSPLVIRDIKTSCSRNQGHKTSFQAIVLKIKATIKVTGLVSRSSFKKSKQQVRIIKATRLVYTSSFEKTRQDVGVGFIHGSLGLPCRCSTVASPPSRQWGQQSGFRLRYQDNMSYNSRPQDQFSGRRSRNQGNMFKKSRQQTLICPRMHNFQYAHDVGRNQDIVASFQVIVQETKATKGQFSGHRSKNQGNKPSFKVIVQNI